MCLALALAPVFLPLLAQTQDPNRGSNEKKKSVASVELSKPININCNNENNNNTNNTIKGERAASAYINQSESIWNVKGPTDNGVIEARVIEEIFQWIQELPDETEKTRVNKKHKQTPKSKSTKNR